MPPLAGESDGLFDVMLHPPGPAALLLVGPLTPPVARLHLLHQRVHRVPVQRPVLQCLRAVVAPCAVARVAAALLSDQRLQVQRHHQCPAPGY